MVVWSSDEEVQDAVCVRGSFITRLTEKRRAEKEDEGRG